MSKKILLLGASGMLGSALAEILARDFEVLAKTSVELDLLNYERVGEVIAETKPDFVVNAAAYTAVDDAERNEDFATAVNGGAVSALALACAENNATLVHFSTDYIFDGECVEGYREDAKPNPLNAYGRSKLAGEQAIQASGCRYAIIRTSWLFGANGNEAKRSPPKLGRAKAGNFVDTMLTLGRERDEIKVVADQIGAPTFTRDLAEATRELMNTNVGGIFHLTNSGTTSWADFATEIFRQAKLNVKVIPITSKEFPRPAKRPKNSTLINTKRSQLRNWQKALAEYLKDVES